MLRRCALLAVAAGAMWVGSAASAEACPSCKEANQTDNRLPMAYQASILFMLGMPFTLATCFGIGLYRMNKAQEEAVRAFESGEVWEGPPADATRES